MMIGYNCRRCLGGYPTVAPGVKPVMALREVLLEVGSSSRMKILIEKKFAFFFVSYISAQLISEIVLTASTQERTRL